MSQRVQQENIFWNETTTNLGASATFTGAARDVGTSVGTQSRYAAFNVTATAGVAGTVRIEMSNDGTTWYRASADTAVSANGVVTLSVPVVTRYYRGVYVNGAGAQTGTAFAVNSSFTAA